jgi:hypothetical protein
MLTELLAVVAKHTADPVPMPATKEQPQPATDKPIYLATKAEVEEWLRKRFNVKKVTIISGMDNGVPSISSPKELDSTLVNVHKEGDSTYVLVEEKQRRASEEHKINLGLREALLCHAKWQEIHKEWYTYLVYFSETIIEVNNGRYVVGLSPSADGCNLDIHWLYGESNGRGQFARLRWS